MKGKLNYLFLFLLSCGNDHLRGYSDYHFLNMDNRSCPKLEIKFKNVSTVGWYFNWIKLNRWGGDKNKQGTYRELGLLRTDRMLFIKWTAEGMVKGMNLNRFRVFHDVRAYVSCREYVSILLRVWFPWIKVAPRYFCILPSLTIALSIVLGGFILRE